MKKNLAILLAMLMFVSLILGGCATAESSGTSAVATTAQVQTNTTAKTTQAATTTTAKADTTTTAKAESTTTTALSTIKSDDVWNLEGWPDHPAGVEMPGWEFLPAISDEFKFRQTDAGVEREMEGNMYKQGYPLVKDTETLSILCSQAVNIVDISTDHWLMDKLQEQTNIKIEWNLIPAASWSEGRNLAIASGDLTDMIIGGGFTKSEQLLYGEQQGILVDLKPYLTDEYTLYISHLFAERQDILDFITTPSGYIYGLFSNACNFHVSMGHKMWVNTAWLDTLGIEKPTTIDEFTEMLRAFKNNDPNGNGEADELPLVGSPKSWNSRIDDFIVNAFTFHPVQANYLVADEDGVASMSIIKDEYQEALKYINSIYNEGLVDKDSFVRDSAAYSGLGLAYDYDIIGTFPGGYYGVTGYDILHTNERSAVWEPISPLKGPEGVQICYQDPFGSFATGQFVVTNAAENPALCVRWIDYFFSPMSDVGEQDVDWRYSEEGELNLFYKDQAYYTPLDVNFDGRTENKRVESTGFPYAYVSFAQRAMNAAENANSYDSLMYGWTAEYMEPYANKNYFPASFFVPLDVVEDYNTSLTDIMEYTAEMATKFMTGEADLDKDWDEYIQTLHKLGYDLVIEQAQAAYDAYYNK